jgi:hypothetical protein
MTIDVLMSAINTFGLPIALLLFMTYQDQKRKAQDLKERQEQTARIQALEDYQKGDLARIAVESATAMQNSSEANRELVNASRAMTASMCQLTLAIRTRPCLENVVEEMDRQRNAG